MNEEQTIHWKVQGMSCTNCALSIEKYLEKKGQKNVKVNFIGGDVSFDKTADTTDAILQKGINSLGYNVVNEDEKKGKNKLFFQNHLQRFWFCLIFTVPLLLHMVGLHIAVIMNPYVQLALTLP
ncbi:MAG: cadmium-translocating P-type ATPase, partial [Bacteroidota bacterium]|nr:cadmium-translocating P-type ATPase [Bacteroidota bacterium]